MRNVRRGRSRETTGQQLESGVNPWWGLGLMCVWWNVMVLVFKRTDSLLLQPMRLVDEHTFIYLLDFVPGRRWKDGVKEKRRRKRRKEPFISTLHSSLEVYWLRKGWKRKLNEARARKKRRTSRRKRKMKKGLENEARKLSYSQIQVQEWITQIVFSPTSLFLHSISIISLLFSFSSLIFKRAVTNKIRKFLKWY